MLISSQAYEEKYKIEVNKSIKEYNSALLSFPTNLGALIKRFKKLDYIKGQK